MKNLLHCGRLTDKLSKHSSRSQLALQPAGMCSQASFLYRAVQDHLQRGRLDRLLQVPERAKIVHRFKRGFDASESREDDGLRHRSCLMELFEQRLAIHLRHIEVGDYSARIEALQFNDCISPVKLKGFDADVVITD